jgi:hypothetical protein
MILWLIAGVLDQQEYLDMNQMKLLVNILISFSQKDIQNGIPQTEINIIREVEQQTIAGIFVKTKVFYAYGLVCLLEEGEMLGR